MLLEGLAQFHQHSIWIFEASSMAEFSEYVFPLITPTLVREQHLIIAPLKSDPHRVFEKERTETERIFSLRSDTMALVNTMTTSTEDYDAFQKVKIEITLTQADFRIGNDEQCLFDLSGLDRLAVHRNLRSFKVAFMSIPQHRTSLRGLWGTRVDQTLNNMKTELDIVGKALMPNRNLPPRFPVFKRSNPQTVPPADWAQVLRNRLFVYRKNRFQSRPLGVSDARKETELFIGCPYKAAPMCYF
jgi:hypothetical protein